MKIRLHIPIYVLLTALMLCCLSIAEATNVQLLITYNGKGVANNDITIKAGDMSLGRGKTDAGGNVTINASALPSNSIDVYGAVQTNNGSKTWDVKGWVALNDNNYAELRFEDVFKEMDIPAGMFAEAWGLTFSTSGGSGRETNNATVKTTEPVVSDAGAARTAGTNCEPINSVDFAKYKKSVSSEPFDDGKAGVIKSFFSSNCYTAVQAMQLIELVTFENTRLELAKKGYKNCANQGMYLVDVSPALEMSMSREELRDYINGEEDDEEVVYTPRPRPVKEAKPEPAPTPRAEPEPKPAPAPMVQDDRIGFRTEKGEPFIAYLDGVQLNTTPSNDVTAPLKSPHSTAPRVKIVFEDKSIPVLEKKVLLTGTSDYYVFIVKINEKGDWVVRGKL